MYQTYKPLVNPRDALQRVAGAQVTDGRSMANFLDDVKEAVEDERGSPLDDRTLKGFRALKSKAAGTTDKKAIASIFGQVKSGARDSGAPQTANAITQAARWYYYNIEGGSSGSSAPSSSGGFDLAPGGFEQKFYQKPWFMPVAISGGVLLLGSIIILATRK